MAEVNLAGVARSGNTWTHFPLAAFDLTSAKPFAESSRVAFAAGADPTLVPVEIPPILSADGRAVIAIGDSVGGFLMTLREELYPDAPEDQQFFNAALEAPTIFSLRTRR